jgi:flagellar protein FliS
MNVYSAYRKNSIESASKEEIMLMLMEGAILRLKSAQQSWDDDEKTKARELRSQALAIITELDNTLDRANGDTALVEELDALYGFMIRELNRATAKDDFGKLQAVEETMESLYQGFKDAVAASKQQPLENNASASYEEMNAASTKLATL